MLPAQILLRQPSPSDPAVSATPSALLQLILAEAQTNGPGAVVLMGKLADALSMYALWQCLTAGTVERGLPRAISDPCLGSALLAVHQDPQHPWTVASLADKVHLSRAAFARRFAQSVGTSPMEYVTALRMQQAHAALAERGISVTEAEVIAGYAVETFRETRQTHFLVTDWQDNGCIILVRGLISRTEIERRLSMSPAHALAARIELETSVFPRLYA